MSQISRLVTQIAQPSYDGKYYGRYPTGNKPGAYAAQLGATAGLNGTLVPAQTLWGYLRTLGQSAGGIMSGQHCDYYSGTPMDVFAGSGPNWTIGSPGPSTGLCPGFLSVAVQGPYNGGAPTMQTLGGANNVVSVANAWSAAGGLLQVVAWFNNPANPDAATTWLTNPALGDAGNDLTHNPFPDILTPGTTIHNAWIANLAQIAALLERINGPYVLRIFEEVNVGDQWWEPPAGFCTTAQFVALFQQTRAYFISQGITFGANGQVQLMFNINPGVGNYTTYYPDTFDSVYVPGTSIVDVLGVDAYPPAAGDQSQFWTALATVAPGRPMIYSDAGAGNPSSIANFTHNNYTEVAEVVASDITSPISAIIWYGPGGGGSWALCDQNGAAAAMSTSPMLNRSNIPAGIA